MPPEVDEDEAYEIKCAHVVGPLGEPKCPTCGAEGEKRGSMDWGPFYWECDRGHQWGHA